MYLTTTKNKKTGVVYLYAAQSIYDPITKKNKKQYISLGSLDKLKEKYDDPIAYYKQYFKNQNEKKTKDHVTLYRQKVGVDINQKFNLGFFLYNLAFDVDYIARVYNNLETCELTKLEFIEYLKGFVFYKAIKADHEFIEKIAISDEALEEFRDNYKQIFASVVSEETFDDSIEFHYILKIFIEQRIVSIALKLDRNKLPMDFVIFNDIDELKNYYGNYNKYDENKKFILVGEELDIYDEFQYIMKYRITKTNREDQKDFINQIKPLLDAEKSVVSCRKFFGEVTERFVYVTNKDKKEKEYDLYNIVPQDPNNRYFGYKLYKTNIIDIELKEVLDHMNIYEELKDIFTIFPKKSQGKKKTQKFDDYIITQLLFSSIAFYMTLKMKITLNNKYSLSEIRDSISGLHLINIQQSNLYVVEGYTDIARDILQEMGIEEFLSILTKQEIRYIISKSRWALNKNENLESAEEIE